MWSPSQTPSCINRWPTKRLLGCDDASSVGGRKCKFIITVSAGSALALVGALFPWAGVHLSAVSCRTHHVIYALCCQCWALFTVNETSVLLAATVRMSYLSRGILMCLFNAHAVPEGQRTSSMWQIPTSCWECDHELWVTLWSPATVLSNIVFLADIFGPSDGEPGAAAPKRPTIGCLFWERNAAIPLLVEGGDESGWSNILGVLH